MCCGEKNQYTINIRYIPGQGRPGNLINKQQHWEEHWWKRMKNDEFIQ